MGRDDELSRWWSGLTNEERAQARGLAAGESMPPEVLVSLTHAGVPQAAAWWPSGESGPTFTVPADLVKFVAEQG